MRLPAHARGGVEIGISDVLSWRDCTVRAEWGMRRHEGREAPEMQSSAAAYGSAIHLCITMLEAGSSPQEALSAAFRQYRQWLEEGDLRRLRDDMERYLTRQRLGVRTLLNEGEISIRLFQHPTAGQVWLRGRIDRLYQSLADPRHLIHVDYKSSRWSKTLAEVNNDLQMWSYAVLIDGWFRGLYPELHGHPQIHQIYDQLRHGEVQLAVKTKVQLEGMRGWLIEAITAMIEDDDPQPSFNPYCSFCGLVADCPVVREDLTDWALTKIAALMPREELLNKDGSVSKRKGPVKLDAERLPDYVADLAKVKRAATTLDAFAKEVTGLLKQLPDDRLAELGKQRQERSGTTIGTAAKRLLVDELGLDAALAIFDLSMASIERSLGDDLDLLTRVQDLTEKHASYSVIEDLKE